MLAPKTVSINLSMNLDGGKDSWGIIEPGGSGFECEQRYRELPCNHFNVRRAPSSLDLYGG